MIFYVQVQMFFQNVIFKLCKTFSVGKEENNSFRYLGLSILKNKNNYITINQNDYINQLNKIIIEPSCKHQHLDSITPNESDMMRAKIRQIL